MVQSETEKKELVTRFIKENTFKEANLIKDDTMLFREGFFDSMGFVMLIDFLESNFNIKTNDSDLIEENFESINAIAGFIGKKIKS